MEKNDQQVSQTDGLNKITEEQARNDFERQLDFLKITPLERQNNSDVTDLIVEAIKMGRVVITPDNLFVQTLNYPLGNNEDVKKLTFKSRLQERDLRIHLKGVKANDIDGRLMAHVAALTGVNSGILGYLDKSDLKISHAYINFFV